ncbi:Calmodulin-binding transcription activator 3 [Raphanus sativus]|uniref:Calmodulin-binding transcription activator 3 n=1 Tax=Raphanus sativus TaxID=3726 RepID=A0A6J0NFW1_RAPSA|nr:calmodulin-binding transcription activator 3 [Raphanus sativus]KAJ4902762.1 Calmodulin-binding transcription activator 3 [Raphanus sativus]
MAEARRFSPNSELDVGQILSEARNRWLRPPEICEILQNYQKFQISTEPPTTPASGSVFLFDRKVLRYFRKDGHNWRKKRDGKTVKEAHERLKAGSVDVLHCYYAHGQDNENFQRRSYWMLQEELSHIVFVHYLEVKGSRVSTSYNRMQRTEDSAPSSQETGEVYTSERNGYASGSINQYDHSNHSQATDSASVNGVHTPELEDAESAYNQQGSSILYSHQALQQPPATSFDPYYQMFLTPRDSYQKDLRTIPSSTMVEKSRTINGPVVTNSIKTKKSIDSQTWEEILGNCGSGGGEGLPMQPHREHEVLDQMLQSYSFTMQDFASLQESMVKSQTQELNSGLTSDHSMWFQGQAVDIEPNALSNLASSEKAPYLSTMKQHLLDGALGEEGLKKMDSFNRWMSKELGELGDVGVIADTNESFTHSSSTAYWEEVESEDVSNVHNSRRDLDGYVMSPSLSKEQLFSIIDFAPNWTYVGCEVKVLVSGKFLKTAETREWSCMFGQTEVPADIIANGILECVAPMHEAGRVPFYVTCSNRLACSEVREFEYKVLESQVFDRETDDSTACNSIESLEARFVKLLCSKSDCPNTSLSGNDSDLSQVSEKISLLLFENDDGLDQMLMNEISQENMKNNLLQEALKESLHSWLLQKIAEGGKGPNVLDEGGQGILHFAAALGYNWALEPTIVAGVSVDFRDVNGWTALHWAAFFGRELIIGSLIALGASPGTLTDPNPDFPSGSTPSDLAYANGYKGIAGYLSEYALRAHVSLLSLNEKNAAVETAPSPSSSALTDSLTAVRNASQAAARIHQVFRAQSFQKKQMKELGDRKLGMSEERALSMLAPKTHKQGRAHSDDSVQAAAIRIQNKFRGYKGRKDYLITRQRIIKIQAHVRGYQVRKNYRKIIWSVGILEKVILRWRRKGAGLRGFKSDALVTKMQDGTEKEEDDDFFKQGRKQTEERLEKALARVKSMAQYPEARDQYRRLLNVVNDIQESKVEKALANSEEAACFDDDLIDIEALLGDDDTLMMPMPSTLWNT